MLALLGTEAYKQFRRLRTYVAFSVVIVLPTIITIALNADPPTPGQSDGEGLAILTVQTGLVVPGFALRIMSAFFIPILAAMFGGDSVAGEAAWGNLRAILVRPVGRGRLLIAKLGVAIALTWVVTILVALTGLIAGVAFFGWHPLDIPFLGVHESTTDLLQHVGVATAYVAWSMTAVVAFGFAFSTLTDTPAGAIAAAFGLYVTSSILDAIEALGSIRDFFPTHYNDAWVELFTRGTSSDRLWTGVLTQLVYLVIFGGFGWWWFRRKDILS